MSFLSRLLRSLLFHFCWALIRLTSFDSHLRVHTRHQHPGGGTRPEYEAIDREGAVARARLRRRVVVGVVVRASPGALRAIFVSADGRDDGVLGGVHARVLGARGDERLEDANITDVSRDRDPANAREEEESREGKGRARAGRTRIPTTTTTARTPPRSSIPPRSSS